MRPIFPTIKWIAVAALFAVPIMISAQDDDPETEFFANSNPTGRLITPRLDQSEDQQLADEFECYAWACEELEWDPYEAYTELVGQGYAVALTPEEMEAGLICLAAEGAVAGAVAGEILDGPDRGAEIGAAIAVSLGVVRSPYLILPDDPEAQRIVSRFERTLHNWERKFAACLRPRGYRVPSF